MHARIVAAGLGEPDGVWAVAAVTADLDVGPLVAAAAFPVPHAVDGGASRQWAVTRSRALRVPPPARVPARAPRRGAAGWDGLSEARARARR